MDEEFRDFIGQNALSIDLINITPLDDLHSPHGIIKEAQDLAAEAFGAKHTFFSVQGTSGAIMTMIMSVCNPEKRLLFQGMFISLFFLLSSLLEHIQFIFILKWMKI